MKHANQKVNHLVITAGGYGTRMRSINPKLPKEMLPAGNKPIIQYAVEEGLLAGIENVIIVINKTKDVLRRYFRDLDFAESLFPGVRENLERISSTCHFDFVYQDIPKGEADAIGLAEPYVGNNPFAIVYPDDLHFPPGKVLKGICDMYERYEKNVCALTEVNRDNARQIGNTGRVNLEKTGEDLYTINEFLPKTMGHFRLRFEREFRTCGYMVSRCEIFGYINRLRDNVTGEFNDIRIRKEMIREYGFLGYHPGTRFFDVGNPEGYSNCLDFLEKHKEV